MAGIKTMIPTLWPHPDLQAYWASGLHKTEGATQPHIQALLYHLVLAINAQHVVELGVWKGATSRWLACAVEANGGGTLTLVDTDQACLNTASTRVALLDLPRTEVHTVFRGTMEFLDTMNPATQFMFMDDDKKQVAEKFAKLRAQGRHVLVAVHDAETISPELRQAEGMILLETPPEPSSGQLALAQL